MQSSYWVALLSRIPAEEHSKLMMVTSSGTEISIQAILMLDSECLGIKGRLSGSQDNGRVYFIPFDHIDYLGFARQVTDEEFRTLFGEAGSLVRADALAGDPAARPTAMPTMIVAPAPAVPALPPELQHPTTVLLEPTPGGRVTGSGMRTPIPNRAALLESIRARGLTPRPTTSPSTSGV